MKKRTLTRWMAAMLVLAMIFSLSLTSAYADSSNVKVTVDGVAVTTGFTYTAATGVLAFGTAPGNNKKVKVIYDSGAEINFMIIHKPAVIQFQKHVAPKIITPEMNQDADGYKFGYRNVGIADGYENKRAGIYMHRKPI